MAGQNYFLPSPFNPFYGFYNANEDMSDVFFPHAYDSCPGSGYKKQFSGEEMAPRQQDHLLPLQAWMQDNPLCSLQFQVWKAVQALKAATQMTTKEKTKRSTRHDHKQSTKCWSKYGPNTTSCWRAQRPEPHGERSLKS